jgi:hypothetical protein
LNTTAHLSEKAQYEHALGVARELLQPYQMELLQFGISIRHFSPKVELFRQLYTTIIESLSTEQQERTRSCSAWIYLSNVVACSKEEAQDALR